MWNNFLLLLHFRVAVNISEALYQVISKKNFGFGVLKQFDSTCLVPNFFSKKHSTLMCLSNLLPTCTLGTLSRWLCLLPDKEYVHLERKRGGGRCFFTQIEPNWPLPYSTVPVPWLKDARPAGWVTYCSICPRTMARAKNRADKGSILL